MFTGLFTSQYNTDDNGTFTGVIFFILAPTIFKCSIVHGGSLGFRCDQTSTIITFKLNYIGTFLIVNKGSLNLFNMYQPNPPPILVNCWKYLFNVFLVLGMSFFI